MADQTDSHQRIFGTPLEPLFNHCRSAENQELVQCTLSLLIKKNSEDVKTATPEQFIFRTNDSVQFLFLTCEKLKLPEETKFQAMNLFERFMLKHVKELYSYVLTSKNRNKNKSWMDIKARVHNQVFLRVISCIQIASKVTSHYRILSTGRARKILKDAGHNYTLDGILCSELRILKTLGFNVTFPSVLVYLETVLEMLGYISIEVKLLHHISISLLEVCYLRHGDIYTRLHQAISGNHSYFSEEEKKKFSAVHADKMLLVASVVSAVAFIVEQSNADEVISHVSRLTEIDSEDIVDFSAVIIRFLQDTEST
ncbi:hypothetical protein ACJMK2_008413 [Sinanodonta woodiana]|uniref:Cyclin N-terminal domain-containing protein n=1 Tax=Sinanodonta woodiana TaxID=1069815 RepID=A0ABD3VLI7_SINWO